jgi:hypothetical protein
LTKLGLNNKALVKTFMKRAFRSSMAAVTGTISFLQLVVFLPLLEVDYPANARIITDPLLEVATFDIVPTDDLFPLVIDLDEESEKPLNDKWEACDF